MVCALLVLGYAATASASLHLDDVTRSALLTVALTVLLSVIAHGVTAGPLAWRFGAWAQRRQRALESGAALEPQPSGTLSRRGRR